MTPFTCASCGTRLPAVDAERCDGCGTAIERAGPILLLVPSTEALAARLERAARGRESWYRADQEAQLTGPYRHHLARRRRLVQEIFAARTRRPQVVVDAGCGDGVNLRWLREEGQEVYGTDYNLTRLERAAGGTPVDGLALADLTDWRVASDSVDLIFCNHVLEHIDDDAAALGELHRALRPGGTLVLGTPNEGAAAWRLAYALEPWYRSRTDHVHFYTAASLSERCTDAGFVVERTEHIGWGVPSFTLDALVRRFAWVDEAFERVGRRVAPRQATSLYLVLRKDDA